MNLTRWLVRSQKKDEEIEQIEKKHKISKFSATILANRVKKNCDLEKEFFCSKLENPFKMKDMDLAVLRIKKAVELKEKVAIYADYDCDGICAGTMLFQFFKSIGLSVVCHVPERSEGYGLNFKEAEKLKQSGVKLIVTVDNGITAIEEAKSINKLGMDLIVTDHHKTAEKIPQAVAIVNPKREDDCSSFKEISGGVVALKLIAALLDGNLELALKKFGDLAAISTIGDVMPIVNENRLIVKIGLKKLKETENLGLKQLLKLSEINFSAEINPTAVAFLICPKINAPGRLNCAKAAFNFLNCYDEEKAAFLAEKIVELNLKRQELEKKFLKDIEKTICLEYVNFLKPIIFVHSNEWSEGLIGSIAGKLVNKFNKPAIVVAINGDLIVGSARSFEGNSIYEALKFCESEFLKWGGHELAGGFRAKLSSLEKIKRTIDKFSFEKKPTFKTIVADMLIKPEEIDIFKIRKLEEIGPFGNFNPQPIFLMQNLELIEIVSLSNFKHVKLKFQSKERKIDVVCFNVGISQFYYKVGKKFNIMVNVEIGIFKGKEQLNFKLIEMRPVEVRQVEMLKSAIEFLQIKKGKFVELRSKERVCPTEAEIKFVFSILKRLKIFRNNEFVLFTLICSSSISYCKLILILEILLLEGLIKRTIEGIEIVEVSNAVNLKENSIFKMLRS